MAPTTGTGIVEPSHPDLPEPWRRVRAAFLLEKQRLSGSSRTAVEYGRIVDRFLASVPDPATVRPIDVEEYCYGPWTCVPASSTINVRLAATSGLYQLARVNGLVAANPAALVRRPKAIAPLPRGVEPEAIRLLLNAIPDHAAGKRDRAIVLLILLTGVRRSEALGVRAGDVDWQRGEFLTHVKGGRERRRALPEPVREAILTALVAEDRTPEELAPEERLFRISGSGFAANLARYAGTAGLTGVCAHALRHSAAQLRRRSGAPIEEIGQLLGHQSLMTTEIYLRRLETEPDEGWRDVVGVLGLGPAQPERRVIAERAPEPIEDRPPWRRMVWARSRAGPIRWQTAEQLREQPFGLSDRRVPDGQQPLSDGDATARDR